MRLTQQQSRIIREQTRSLFGEGVRVLLFGSRVDDSQRGGDIDLLVEVDQPQPNRAALASRLAARLQRALGDQRIDVVLIDPQTPEQPIHRLARAQGRLL